MATLPVPAITSNSTLVTNSTVTPMPPDSTMVTNTTVPSPPVQAVRVTTNATSQAHSPPPSLPNKKPPPPPASHPPSPRTHLIPPRTTSRPVKSPPANTTVADNDGTGPSTRQVSMPLVLGVAFGVGALVVMLIILLCYNSKKKKKGSLSHNQMRYYTDTSINKGNSDYFTSGPDSTWQTEQKKAGQNAVGGWRPPPPTNMASGEMTTAVYSGPHGAPPLPPPSPTMALGFNKSTFTYEELASATSNFAQANLLGQGGFGYVHKGVLPNGKEIAVKQLKAGSGQGEREFQAEVDIISRVHHRHLVSLVGYCCAGVQRLLVYEFVPNKTLEYHLHGKGLTPMDWPTRLKISLGSAKGLAYLHEDCHPRIIHRDIKSANILIDFKFEAMVADFGLAKLTLENATHVSTRVMGTFGYLAPEYASSGKLTEKSDVFSYGVMLLELITGRRPVDTHSFIEDSLVDWARPVLSRALADGNYDEISDPRLDGNYDPMEMARMVACAAACVRHSARRRPKMSQIVRALEGDVSLEDLNEGMRPGQSMLFSSGSDYETNSYTTNMRRIRRVALASPEYSGEYSGPIPDYGHHRSASSSDYSEELNPIGNQRHRPQL